MGESRDRQRKPCPYSKRQNKRKVFNARRSLEAQEVAYKELPYIWRSDVDYFIGHFMIHVGLMISSSVIP